MDIYLFNRMVPNYFEQCWIIIQWLIVKAYRKLEICKLRNWLIAL